MKIFQVKDHWCLLSYFTVCPEAPDGSGRVLMGAADLKTNTGKVAIMDKDGNLLDLFGNVKLDSPFWHTGLWQSWSPDCKYVYYQSGESYEKPSITRRELATGKEVVMEGDMEGAPSGDALVTGGLLGMLYAAGYADGHFYPEKAPVPFGERDKHGLFTYNFDTGERKLALSVQQIKDMINDPDLDKWDEEQMQKTGDKTTLMAYCMRWATNGQKTIFHFGNHCVDKRRGEPKITYVLTCNKDLTDIKVALKLNKDAAGTHWSYQPDGKRLSGYGYDPADPLKKPWHLMEVNDDGTDYHTLATCFMGGGHPSRHPFLDHLVLTDVHCGNQSHIALADIRTDKVVWDFMEPIASSLIINGRNPSHVDNHPVFSRDGKSIYFNRMKDGLSQLCRVEIPEEILNS